MAGACADATADEHCFVFGRDEFSLPTTRPGTRIPPMEVSADAAHYKQRTCLPLDGVCKGAPQIVELRTRAAASGPWRYVASAVLERSLVDAAAFYTPQTSLTRSEVGTIATGAWEFRFLRTHLQRVALIHIAYYEDRERASPPPATASAADAGGVIDLDADDRINGDSAPPRTAAQTSKRARHRRPPASPRRAKRSRTRAFLDSCSATGDASEDEDEEALDDASDADENGNLVGFIDDALSDEDIDDEGEEEIEDDYDDDYDDYDYGDDDSSDCGSSDSDASPAPRAARPARAAKRFATERMSHVLRSNGGRIPGYEDSEDEYSEYSDDAMAEEVDEDEIDLEEESRLAHAAARRIERMRSRTRAHQWRRRAGATARR